MTGRDENRLPEIYRALQGQLEAQLSASRNAVRHPGAVGDGTESNWLSMLQAHLPHRYQAERGFVIDSRGQQSEQLDVVIFDHQYTPLLYNRDAQRVIPAESVYAVLEVKQALDKAHMEYAGAKAASVRGLHRTSATIVHAGGTHDPVEPKPIVAGVLTTYCSWKPPFGEPFMQVIREAHEDLRLDIGCCARAGGFDAVHGEEVSVETSPQETALAFFFFRLLRRLQQIGTVPAMDYTAYLEGWAG